MKVRVGWIDTDASGRIHFSAVFRWVEAAEMALYRELDLLEGSVRRPRRHLEVEYLRPIAFDDELDVELAVSRVGRTSISFEWRILRGEALAVEGRHTVVQVDDGGVPEAISESMRRLLSGS